MSELRPSGEGSAESGNDETEGDAPASAGEHCQLCGRTLAVVGDPMAADCGGDCWGCVGEIEWNHGTGDAASVKKVTYEMRYGLRDRNGVPTGERK